MADGSASPKDRPSRRPRKRRRRACDSCFKKKIQCDAEFPQCNWCKHHNLACTYNRILGQSETRSATVPVIEATRQSTLNPSEDAPRSVDLIPTESIGHLRWKGTFPANLTYFKGRHIFSDEGHKWIESRVGESVNFEKLSALELQWLKSLRLPKDPSTISRPNPELPDRSIIEKYALIYSSAIQSLVFPVISQALFAKTLDLAYSPTRAFGSDSARACVYSFLTLVALFGFDDNVNGAMDCASYASTAQSFMPQILEEMTVDGFQSLIMLVQYQYFLGDLQAATVSISIATRLLYTLGAHTLPTNDGSAAFLHTYDKNDMACHLRDLFWLCYSFDKDICLRTGQPPCINDSHCDLTLHLEYVEVQYSNLQKETIVIDSHTLPLFPWDLSLSKLKSKVYEDLYSASALQKSVSELLSSIRSLDETLEQWRLSVPVDFRPTLYFSRETPVSVNHNTQLVMLRLAYYHCVTSIHQASSRFQLSSLGADNGLDSPGVNSSISLSIIASRSTLSYLQRALTVIHGECFWIVLFHAVAAVLTLFCNILANPLDIDSYHDVNLLHNVPGLIRRIPIRKFTLGEVIHLKFLDGFTTELAALCVSAMSKARDYAESQSVKD